MLKKRIAKKIKENFMILRILEKDVKRNVDEIVQLELDTMDLQKAIKILRKYKIIKGRK